MPPQVQRGAVGAASLHGTKAEANRPVLRVPMVRPKVAPEGKRVGYRTDVARCLHIRIVAHTDLPEMAELTHAVLVHHPEGVIKFNDWDFETTHPSVIRWLDQMIQSGKLRGVARDIHTLRMRCEFCEQVFANNPKGMEQLAYHLMTHDTSLEDLGTDDLTAFFGNLDAVEAALDEAEADGAGLEAEGAQVG